MSMHCGECEAKFSTVDALNAHMKTFHPKRFEYPVCENCNKALTGHRSLARHHIGHNSCQCNYHKNVQKIAGLTITVTPPVGKIVEVNIFLRPGRSHVGNW